MMKGLAITVVILFMVGFGVGLGVAAALDVNSSLERGLATLH